jgi:hypothetical protein
VTECDIEEYGFAGYLFGLILDPAYGDSSYLLGVG